MMKGIVEDVEGEVVNVVDEVEELAVEVGEDEIVASDKGGG